MSFKSDIEGAFDDLREMTPCTVVHAGHTYSAVKVFDVSTVDVMQQAGYMETAPDMRVMLKLADLQAPNPAPRDTLTVDDVPMRVMNNGYKRNDAFVTLDLNTR